MRSILPSAAALGLLPLPLCAQQFGSVTNFVGPASWCEGVECADVDHDGDLDVFFAEGDGYMSAGTKRQNILIVNKLVEIGAWNFADESVARLGSHVSNSKMVTTGDVNGDGWVDALFCNAFNTDTPFLYINQGAANPGFFNMESAIRGLTTALSSGSAQFGDLDDDGDLDLIINDTYAGTGKPRLYFNGGTGVFTENAAALGAPNKTSQMDVQLVDIDNDGDLDFFGDCRAVNAGGNHYLMLNNGSGTFTDQSSLLAAGTGNNYEAEAGDLDGDNDLDLFFVSLSGFSEGAVRNNVVPNGTLTFTNQTALAGSVDDNEIALIDYDIDGDYDVLVGSLGSHEYLWRNNGALSFTDQSVQIVSVGDSSLDCTLADLNNDGKYDILTAQGESGSFINKYYRNTGTADTLKPVVTSHTNPSSMPAAGPVVVHAKIRDQVLDDGVNYVTASAAYVINSAPNTAAVSITGAGFSPAAITVRAGATVTWTNNSGVSQSVQSTTAPYAYDSGTIGAGGTYAYAFVSPGTYSYQSVPSGLTGQVTVIGSASSAITTCSGGQLYRFRMNDTSGGAGIQLCYELRFVDWPGNVTVTDTRSVTLTGTHPGVPYCFGDGSGASCPCANQGFPGHGCANSQNPSGALLASAGTTSPDVVVLTSSGELPTVLSIFLQGDLTVASVPFGDGLRCAGGSLKRLYVKNAAGGVVSAPDLVGGDPNITTRSAALGDTIPPGGIRYYQVYYRDPDLTYCASPMGSTFNVSGGLIITW